MNTAGHTYMTVKLKRGKDMTDKEISYNWKVSWAELKINNDVIPDLKNKNKEHSNLKNHFSIKGFFRLIWF